MQIVFSRKSVMKVAKKGFEKVGNILRKRDGNLYYEERKENGFLYNTS